MMNRPIGEINFCSSTNFRSSGAGPIEEKPLAKAATERGVLLAETTVCDEGAN